MSSIRKKPNLVKPDLMPAKNFELKEKDQVSLLAHLQLINKTAFAKFSPFSNFNQKSTLLF